MASDLSKKVWADKTLDERKEWLEKSILADKCQTLSKVALGQANFGSRLEIKIATALLEAGCKVETQFWIRPYRYDFLVDESLIIEVHGDHIHGNPNIFVGDDILAVTKKKVSDVWSRDKIRINHANTAGYDVIVIWESELKLKSPKEIEEIIILKIYENQVNKEINNQTKEI